VSVFIWFMQHVPGLAWVFFRLVVPTWNFVLCNLEALLWIGPRAAGLRVLRDARAIVHTPRELADWYKRQGFRWRADPLWGFLDFSSKPWVSALRNTGDCDDMMVLSAAILFGRLETVRGYAYSKDGGSHAVLLALRGDGTVELMSNQYQMGTFPSIPAAMKRALVDPQNWQTKVDYYFVYGG